MALDDYEIIGAVAEGAQGIVYEAFRKSDSRRAALKRFKPESDSSYDISSKISDSLKEAKLHSRLNHPQIPGFMEHFVDERFGQPEAYIAMDFVDGECICDMAKRKHLFSERQAAERHQRPR